jgi:hypothetical protein
VLSLHNISGQSPTNLKKFAGHHDDGLAELYGCQSLWVIQSVSNKKENSKLPILNIALLFSRLNQEGIPEHLHQPAYGAITTKHVFHVKGTTR